MCKRTSALLIAVCLLVAPAASAQQLGIFELVNGALADHGRTDLQLSVVEWVTAFDEAGQTVFFEDRGNKQLGAHWVPDHPLNGNGTELPWIIDGVDFSVDFPAADQLDAYASAMQTWQDQTCSHIPLVFAGVTPFDYGFVQFLLGFGGTDGFFPFLSHAGFLPASFFDAIAPGGSTSILGVTFTFTWTGIDFDGNGKGDVALREIYYNDAFLWGDGSGGSVDLETVALHEAGHGLSQAHFGKLFRTDKNGKFHFAPRAVMNAGYTGPQRSLRGTDKGGHCSIWGSWPNN